LHLVAGVNVSGALRDDDAVREKLLRLFDAAHARKKLAVLEVGGHIFGMFLDQMLKVRVRGFVVAKFHAFHGEAVARERIRGARSNKLLENFTAGLLRLGHISGARIITGAAHTRKAGAMLKFKAALFIATFFLCCGGTFAQTEKEPIAVVELGGAASVSFHDGSTSGGPNIAVEFTPIEDRLEIETGVTTLFARHSTEWDTDFLFKKPWTLSRKVEFMAGAGPEWIHKRDSGVRTNSVGGEVIGDFMFWPARKHRFGWYLEPGYDYDFGKGHEQSIGISGGLLISIP
jgi:hypothetical protein